MHVIFCTKDLRALVHIHAEVNREESRRMSVRLTAHAMSLDAERTASARAAIDPAIVFAGKYRAQRTFH